METVDMISLITNLGFPVVLSFILLRYILQTIGEKFDNLEETIKKLITALEKINTN
ncbi:hypothetical protein M5X06_08505 [Paenibacillus alvei]|uniref:YvrJ family protein n=1 Tax=Paenibacillus alvei TaxID=44250 RepID=A0ABT4H1Q9_PAEAL|nr:hypothetical protein [Paenibacillus alvei]MCY9762718.1 hypothetical protein [Paenibacillus alvei]MCY9766873.1 hypothetical protein [Paenibacillus alvei]